MRKPLHILGQSSERRDAKENRERILVALRELLKTKAISDICMDELAERAGVGKGTLYRHFKDRTSLCRTLLDADTIALQNETISGFGLPKDAPPEARLCTFLDRLIQFKIGNATLLSEASTNARDQESRFAHPVFLWEHYELSRLLAASGAANPSLSAYWIMSLLDPNLFLWQLAQGQTAQAIAQSAKAFITRGMHGERSSDQQQ